MQALTASAAAKRRARNLLIAIAAAAWQADASGASCSVSTSGVNFGTYDYIATSAPLDSAGTISIACDASVTFAVALSAGSGSYANRTLRSGGNTLFYNLFTDPARV